MTKKEFFDKDFLAFCQKEYDAARHYVKHCGKPKNEHDKWLIHFNKETEKIFKGFLFE